MDIRSPGDPLSECRSLLRASLMGSALAIATLVAGAPSSAQAQQSMPDPGASPAQSPSPREDQKEAGKPDAAAPAGAAAPSNAEVLAEQVRLLMEQVRALTTTVKQLQAERAAEKSSGGKSAIEAPAPAGPSNDLDMLAADAGGRMRLRALLESDFRGSVIQVGRVRDGDYAGGVEESRRPATPETAPGDRFGGYEPGAGFTVAKTEYGTLNVGGYSVFRYLNQIPPGDTFKDHLGRERPAIARNDLEWHRALLYTRGWLFNEKFTFQNNVWGLQSTQQMAMVGALRYSFSNALNANGGIFALPGIFTLVGNFPLWLGTDRVMASEFFRPGFSGGFWLDGDLPHRMAYRAMVGNTISQLGVPVFHLTRNHAYALDLAWMPSTGEYGPKNSLGDYEGHTKPATRFEVFYTQSLENRGSQPDVNSPENTQIRLSDSVLLFETGSLAPGVTVDKALYRLLAVHAGVKHQGNSLDLEFYRRWLGDFTLIGGTVPQDHIDDYGFSAQASRMVVGRKLMTYAFGSYIIGQFNNSWEGGLGLNFYPFSQRNVRLNGQAMYVRRSPTESGFGYYTGGWSGPIFSLAADLLF